MNRRWHLAPFSAQVKALASNVVSSTVHIFRTISSQLLPTPAKSHYTFNLRDISKVFLGICQSTPQSLEGGGNGGAAGRGNAGGTALLSLWCHECLRVFSDRLVGEKDIGWFWELLDDQLGAVFSKKWEEVAASAQRRIIYGDLLNGDSGGYMPMADMDKLVLRMNGFLEDFNGISKRPMELVLFPFAVEHICRVLRIIKQPLGNALLVGVGGSGRQSLTVLAAFVADFKCFQVELTKKYDLGAWHEDVRALLRQAGERNEQTVFLFSDTQIKDEAFVEDLNNLLNMGQVPNLFAADELMAIADGLASRLKELGVSDTSPASVWKLFVAQCRANLHAVLCMSPIGDAFRTRLRKFPSLVNCTTIDWYTPWPEEGLETVANSFFATLALDDAARASAVKACCFIHESVSQLSQEFLFDSFSYELPFLTISCHLVTTLTAHRLTALTLALAGVLRGAAPPQFLLTHHYSSFPS